MKDRLRRHMDIVFAGKPDTDKIRELKEEMTQNLFDKYDDLIAEGKNEEEAYSLAITSVGDVTELVNELAGNSQPRSIGGAPNGEVYTSQNPYTQNQSSNVRQTAVDKEAVRKYRSRKAMCVSIAVVLYILSLVPLFIFQNAVGLIIMFVVIAAATGLIIFSSMAKPAGIISDGNDDDDDMAGLSPKSKATMRVINAVLWPLIVLVYLAVSFSTGAWYITWLIFPISGIIEEIFKAILELSEEKKK